MSVTLNPKGDPSLKGSQAKAAEATLWELSGAPPAPTSRLCSSQKDTQAQSGSQTQNFS